jgi:hypothetical protein
MFAVRRPLLFLTSIADYILEETQLLQHLHQFAVNIFSFSIISLRVEQVRKANLRSKQESINFTPFVFPLQYAITINVQNFHMDEGQLKKVCLSSVFCLLLSDYASPGKFG